MLKRPYKLALLDDEPQMLTILESMLQLKFENSLEICSFTAPELFLEHAEANEVDILITDLNMPGIHGLDLLEKLRLIGRRIHTVVITGDSTLSSLYEVYLGYAEAVIHKPFQPDEVFGAIDHICANLDYWIRKFEDANMI